MCNYPKVEWNKQGNTQKPHAGGRVFYLDAEEEEAEDPNVVITSTLFIKHLYTHVLFDSGTTNSLINHETSKTLSCKSN